MIRNIMLLTLYCALGLSSARLAAFESGLFESFGGNMKPLRLRLSFGARAQVKSS